MTKQKTNLGSFAKRAGITNSEQTGAPVGSIESAPASVPGKRSRPGKGDVVQLTMKIKREDWIQLGELTRREGTSAQGVMFGGVIDLFVKYGLPPPEPPLGQRGG